MINPQNLELPMSQMNFHGPTDVQAIEVQLYAQHVFLSRNEENYQRSYQFCLFYFFLCVFVLLSKIFSADNILKCFSCFLRK